MGGPSESKPAAGLTARGARRSLSHVGGAVRFAGDPALRERMTRAAQPPVSASPSLGDGAGGDLERSLTHGFHAWPGRLHPHTARALIEAAPPGAIADPFMGAGTVPVEAMLQGRLALGNDLNPIGAEVAWVRTRRFSTGALQALVGRAKAVAKKAQALAEAPVLPGDPVLRERLAGWFDPVALAEITALGRCLAEGDAAWQGSPHDPLTRVLRMALSSIVVKASRQVSDSVAKVDRNVAEPTPKGRVLHWLKKRTEELAGQLAAFRDALPEGAPEPRLSLGDARAPAEALPPIAAVVSSPPYPGVYDYLAHHALRCAVLGLPVADATVLEIGSRRATERLGKAVAHERYVADLAAVLAAWSATLVPGGFIAWVIGDGQVGHDVVRVLPLVDQALASGSTPGLAVRATLSQARPKFGPAAPERGGKSTMKEEHLVWIERTT